MTRDEFINSFEYECECAQEDFKAWAKDYGDKLSFGMMCYYRGYLRGLVTLGLKLDVVYPDQALQMYNMIYEYIKLPVFSGDSDAE